jgi:hypothetical protein
MTSSSYYYTPINGRFAQFNFSAAEPMFSLQVLFSLLLHTKDELCAVNRIVVVMTICRLCTISDE